MVLCDEIEPGDEEEVFNLVGVRTQVRAHVFPYTLPQLCVYLQATGHRGVASCRLEVVRAETDEQLLSTPPRETSFTGPLDVITSRWWIGNCTFPDEGLYYVQLYAGERLCCERMLFVAAGGEMGDGQGTS
jgi:hypothetical protein